MKQLTIIMLILMGRNYWLPCQNILPDGGFEVLIDNTCFEPDKGFSHTAFWYSLDANPDLFTQRCSFDEEGLIFWDASSEPYAGENYAGLSSRFNSNSTYISEGIATILSNPLEAEKLYYIELAVRTKGYYQGFPDELIDCPLRPKKHLDIYLSTDSIKIITDPSNATATATGELVGKIEDEFLKTLEVSDWNIVATCFRGKEEATHIGITQPLNDFGALPDCIEEDNGGTFHTHYYDLDEVVLHEVPSQLEASTTVCKDESTEVNLGAIFKQNFIQSATFQWDDGETGKSRILKEVRPYFVEAILSCGVVQIILNVEAKDCEPKFYMPTAFSPNGDHQNDFFAPQTALDTKINSYELRLYDRWGGEIFISNDIDNRWDGQYQNKEVPIGIYLWLLTYELDNLGTLETYVETGEVLLIR